MPEDVQIINDSISNLLRTLQPLGDFAYYFNFSCNRKHLYNYY